MAYDYKGTKITGTSTTSKVFSNSGVSKAKVNDTYFNTQMGHVYKCTTAGSPKNAKWQYVRTDIANKPSLAITSLGAPKRTTVGGNNHYMKAEWKVPSNLTNVKKGDRAQGLYIYWWLGISGTDPKEVCKTGNESLDTHQINLNNLTIGSKTYTRSSFYPNTKKKLSYVTVGVQPYNSDGKGPVTKAKRSFDKPRKPSISAFTFNTENGEVSCTITTDAGTDYRERYDTRYVMTVKNTRTGTTTVASDSSSTSTTTTLTYDASDYQQLSYEQYIEITVKAWARGYAGNSDTVTKVYYVAYPAQATIKAVETTSSDSSGKCTVKLATNSSKAHPVDRVRLEYLGNTTYENVGDIPGGESWTSTDIMDDAQCTALAIGVSDLIPDRGKYTWIRLKTFHASEAVLYRYSAYWRVTTLEVPAATAADDDIFILSTKAGLNGTSIVVQLGWNINGTDDSTGTELTWSADEDAWRSTKAPEEHTFTWSDGTVTSGGVTYLDSATITIKDLEEGTKYYIKARRYLEGDVTTYLQYTETAGCITSETPEAVVATCARYISSDASLPVVWTFSGSEMQTQWQIVLKETLTESFTGNGTNKKFVLSNDVTNMVRVTVGGNTTTSYTRNGREITFNTAPANNAAVKITYTTDTTVIANGEGSIGSTQIGADRLAAFATGNVITFTVQVSTGGGFVVSEPCTVTIIDKPTLSLNVSSTLTTQPLSFGATVSALSDLIVVVTSQGASGQFPLGLMRQTAGDTIYSELISPIWTASGNNWTATVTLPEGLDFWDLGSYSVSVVAVDRSTGLRSDEATGSFSVAWTNKAVDPTPGVTLTPVDTIDDAGKHIQAVDITLTAPTGSAQTDVYDIYRVTPDGAKPIGIGFPLNTTARDLYAPFGDALTQVYRMALRTVNGDVNFADIEYVASGKNMRFDWAEGSLELPYNISISDKYAKDVEFRKHLNGDTDGYWNKNVTRTASLSSDVIRLNNREDVIQAKSLARYTGAVFVRTPDGGAYEANVDVSDMSTEGIVTAIAIDATEIGLTDEFMLPTPFTMA